MSAAIRGSLHSYCEIKTRESILRSESYIIYASSSLPVTVHHNNQILPCEQIPKGLSGGICFPKLRAC